MLWTSRDYGGRVRAPRGNEWLKQSGSSGCAYAYAASEVPLQMG